MPKKTTKKTTKRKSPSKIVTLTIKGPAKELVPVVATIAKKKGVKVTGGGAMCYRVSGTYRYFS